jgi:hypothetical protein
MKKPICIDLCCGSGGWAAGFIAEGYQVVGYDTVDQPEYPGRFVMRDVREMDGRDFSIVSVVVASPLCAEFSRHDQPWTRKRNPPPPDKSIWEACERIATEAGVPLVLENVRGAQAFMGRAKCHYGAYYLWGDPPALMPSVRVRGTRPAVTDRELARARHRRWTSDELRPGEIRGKESAPHDPARRAKIPLDLARHIARVFRPEMPEPPR